MLNLIKYEFIRRYRLISIILITMLALNILLLTRGVGGSMLFLVLSPIVLYIFYLADIIRMCSDDLNKKTGYMLFMTPNSGYKIIWSKLMAAILEGFGLLLIYFLFFIGNGTYIVASIGEVVDFSNILSIINNMFEGSLILGFDLVSLFIVLLTVLIFIIAFITTVYTAMTIRKSLFSEVKFGGLISFIIFLLINWIITYISGWLYGLYYEPMSATIVSTGSFTQETFIMALLPMIAVSIIQIIALTGLSGYLLEKEINL
jgi:hypothetical protein